MAASAGVIASSELAEAAVGKISGPAVAAFMTLKGEVHVVFRLNTGFAAG